MEVGHVEDKRGRSLKRKAVVRDGDPDVEAGEALGSEGKKETDVQHGKEEAEPSFTR